MDRRFLGILAVIVILFGGFFIFSKNSDTKNNSSNNTTTATTNNVMGQGSSGVKLVEYGDFQCPICGLYYQPVKDAVTALESQIYFQFRNLPITQIHPNAFAAARAAQAAALQGKFWEMHDKLYENQSKWSSSTAPLEFYKVYAKDIGLNMDQFLKDYPSTKVNDAINADIAEFNKTGQQQATPTFFLNGKVIDNKELAGANGFPSVEKLTAIIQAEIDKTSKK